MQESEAYEVFWEYIQIKFIEFILMGKYQETNDQLFQFRLKQENYKIQVKTQKLSLLMIKQTVSNNNNFREAKSTKK